MSTPEFEEKTRLEIIEAIKSAKVAIVALEDGVSMRLAAFDVSGENRKESIALALVRYILTGKA